MKEVVKNLEERHKKKGMKLPPRETTSMSSDYRSDIYATVELNANDITMF